MAASGSPGAEAAVVAKWLYRFGTVPRGPEHERDFGPDDDPMAVLGLTRGGRTRRLLEAAYEASGVQGWYTFARVPGPPPTTSACKLYVSPRPHALAAAFPRIAEVFVRSEVRSFKVGRGVEGLLRPDKIMAYFDDRAHLAHVARALGRSLRGCPVQGVPFTADAGERGLLSWGVDPAARETPTSWRTWITDRLAESLTGAREHDAEGRVATALADLRAAGIDPDRWTAGAGVSLAASAP